MPIRRVTVGDPGLGTQVGTEIFPLMRTRHCAYVALCIASLDA